MFLIRQEFALPTEVQCEYAVLGDNRSRGYKYAGSNNLSEWRGILIILIVKIILLRRRSQTNWVFMI